MRYLRPRVGKSFACGGPLALYRPLGIIRNASKLVKYIFGRLLAEYLNP